MMFSKSLKALADSLKRMLAIPLRSSAVSIWYSFSRNSSIRSLSQLPRCITQLTKFCNFFSKRYCRSRLFQSLLRNCTSDLVKGFAKCRSSSCCIVYSRERYFSKGSAFSLERLRTSELRMEKSVIDELAMELLGMFLAELWKELSMTEE